MGEEGRRVAGASNRSENEGSAGAELAQVAQRNRKAFDETLEAYVGQKLSHPVKRLTQGERELWFDATECIWCVFDDPAFVRCEEGSAGTRAERDAAAAGQDAGDSRGLQVYWSLGDVVMPPDCNPAWVAQRIAEEAVRQFERRGFRCSPGERLVDGEPHVGAIVRRAGLFARLIRG